MYYLFVNTRPRASFIQLTFDGQTVDTCTEWSYSLPNIPTFEYAYDNCDSWSSLDEWLSHDEFTLVTSSPNPITYLTHPELYI